MRFLAPGLLLPSLISIAFNNDTAEVISQGMLELLTTPLTSCIAFSPNWTVPLDFLQGNFLIVTKELLDLQQLERVAFYIDDISIACEGGVERMPIPFSRRSTKLLFCPMA